MILKIPVYFKIDFKATPTEVEDLIGVAQTEIENYFKTVGIWELIFDNKVIRMNPITKSEVIVSLSGANQKKTQDQKEKPSRLLELSVKAFGLLQEQKKREESVSSLETHQSGEKTQIRKKK